MGRWVSGDMLTAADFTWDESCWGIEVQIPEWLGYRNPARRMRAQQSIDPVGPPPDDVFELILAPDGRDDAPLNRREVQAVQWALDHLSELSRTVLAAVHEEYPTFRTDLLDVYGPEVAADLAPDIQGPDGLKDLMGLETVFVHRLDVGEAPYVGFWLTCTWEEEHGLGVLLHDTRVVEIGEGEVANTLWIAKRDRDRLKAEERAAQAEG